MRPSKRAGARNPYKPPINTPKVHEMLDSKSFKIKVIERIASIYNITEIHEDDEEILREVRKRFPQIALYIHIGDGFYQYRGFRDLTSYSREKPTSS
jgi:hypothetical protein